MGQAIQDRHETQTRRFNRGSMVWAGTIGHAIAPVFAPPERTRRSSISISTEKFTSGACNGATSQPPSRLRAIVTGYVAGLIPHVAARLGATAFRRARRILSPVMTSVIKLTEENFAIEVLQSDVPVVIDVWGPKCIPCIRLDPYVETISDEYAGTVKIAKIIAPEARKLCAKLRVMGLPTFLLYKDGTELERRTGDDLSEADVREMVSGAAA
jgi:thioredoxin 1